MKTLKRPFQILVFEMAFVFLIGTNAHGQQPAESSKLRSNQRIDQIQLLGTHNSYHFVPDDVAMEIIKGVAPQEALALEISMPPLADQLEKYGVRHFELDLYLDPDGKLFQKPASLAAAVDQGKQVTPFDPEGRMKRPGIKILHSPDFDFRTTVYTLEDALKEVKQWSNQNLRHVPLFLLLELKSDSFFPFTKPKAWDAQALDQLESELLSVISRDQILAPDDIRKGNRTLREVIENQGWPPLEGVRGKIIFLLDNEGRERDLYLQKSEILEGRLIFTSVARTHPAAAWMKRNDPVSQFEEIVQLVESGFLVRTRADAGTVEARRNDIKRREKAIASKAQLISTDFIFPNPKFSEYFVELPKIE